MLQPWRKDSEPAGIALGTSVSAPAASNSCTISVLFAALPLVTVGLGFGVLGFSCDFRLRQQSVEDKEADAKVCGRFEGVRNTAKLYRKVAPL